MSEINAVTESVSVLTDEWARYIDGAPGGVLRWLVSDDSVGLARCFFLTEGSDQGVTPDLFMSIDLPFEGAQSYTAQVLEVILNSYRMDQHELGEEAEGWAPLTPPATADMRGLHDVLEALTRFIPGAEQRVVLCLSPSDWADAQAWADWVRAWSAARRRASVHLIVLDRLDAPLLEGLREPLGDAMLTRAPAVSGDEVADALLASHASEGEGAAFLAALMGMNKAITRSALPELEQHAGRALSVAQGEGWAGARCAVHLLWAEALGAAGERAAARHQHDAALAVAARAVAAKDRLGPRLELQAHMARGAYLVRGQDWASAALDFVEAAVRAEALGAPLQGVEAWRMASWAYAQQGEPKLSLAAGIKGLACGEVLPLAQRRSSTMPQLGHQLMSLVEEDAPQKRAPLGRMLDGALGAGWQQEAWA